MDTLAHLFAYVQQWLLTPIWHCLTGLLDFNGRLGLPFLLISGLIAYLLYRVHRHQQGTAAGSFAGFLGGRAIWLHPSALTRLWGERPRLAEASWLMMLYGLGVFLVSDFVHYWLHRVFHSRWLWEFHKVHHSATVLVPPTASRIHLVEKLAENLLKGSALALYSGAFYWLCGGSVRPYTLFGVGYLVLIFNSLAANLRHSHIWLSFGPRLEHIFNSPAQHQIHHSRDPRHFNHNFGINLSLWDWWFGTLYVTNHQPESLTFGVGPKDNVRYSRLGALILRPFLVTARKLWHALPHPRSRKPQPDLR
ncbi:sterol desaturase family protein [Aeromonas sp. 602396]|uniref:sterol desaturase family protein n=1 Tax=Aeromonas sp. 602396 TaxID=2712042 RepID=UPI003BA375C7